MTCELDPRSLRGRRHLLPRYAMTCLASVVLVTSCSGSSSGNVVTPPTPPADTRVKVSTIAALQAAIIAAPSGTVLALSNGTYANATLNISTSGISVVAESPGGVTLTGRSSVHITGDRTTFSGFQFKNGDIGTGELIVVDGNSNTITECNIVGIIASKYVHFNGGFHDNALTYCNIEGKPGTMNAGPAVHISTSSTIVNHTTVRQCTFLNALGAGGDNGNEPIRIGLGAEQNNVSAAVIEENYFENTGLGDSETISVKSKGNVLRHNTQYNNPLGSFVFRTGSNNTAYGNFFINSGGVRVKEGQNHMIYNNYFEGTAANSSLELTNQSVNPLGTIYVVHNTFYNSGAIVLGGSGANPPQNVVLANNIFFKTGGTILSDLNANATYVSNLFFGGAALGRAFVSSEFTNANPLLTTTVGGIYGPWAGSPALRSASAAYPALLDNPDVTVDATMLQDVEGKSRPVDRTQKALGSVQYNSDAVLYRPLSRRTAGPSYLRALAGG